MNLLAIPWIKAALRSRLYPAVFQWITVAVFAVLLAAALFGPNNAGQNFGMALTWTVWWPLLPLSFVLFGRLWCAICPFAWVTDKVRKAVGVELSPPLLLRRYGLWVIAGLFVLVTYLEEAWGFNSDARKTGYLLLAVLLAVVFFGAFFERRTFCRHVCFIGAFAANYSRAGMLELRADTDRCRDCPTQACQRGASDAAGCPVFLYAPSLDDSGTCELCANCVKNCPRDAIRISTRRPGAELWSIRQPHLCNAVLAAMVAGVVLIERFAQLGSWNSLIATAGAWLHVDPNVSFPLVYGTLLAMFLTVPLVGLVLASLGSQAFDGRVSSAEVRQNLSFAGSAVIPLALAGHLAHGLDRLLMWSRTVPLAAAAMVGWFPGNNGAAWLPRCGILWIEVAVLALGAALALYVGYRLAQRQARRAPWLAYAPHGLLLLLLFAANLYAVAAMMRQL
ncbi:MAG TPA: 4Fe-4S binding protein [Bryobacteraceae bacterium]|nr:4Fe-4S binding protein [Bryobacteraceae bacterium]